MCDISLRKTEQTDDRAQKIQDTEKGLYTTRVLKQIIKVTVTELVLKTGMGTGVVKLLFPSLLSPDSRPFQSSSCHLW